LGKNLALGRNQGGFMNLCAGRSLARSMFPVAILGLVLVGATAARAGERLTTPVAAVTRVSASIPATSQPMTVLQIAARHGLTYSDAGSYVLLEKGSLRVRIYPGTNTLLIAGRVYTVKDPALRSEREVVLSKRVSGFLNFKIGAYRADERVHARVRTLPRPHYQPLPPLPPKLPKFVPAKRAPVPVRATPASVTKVPAAGPIAAERGWVPPARERRWKWIVIHHSDDPHGNLAKYDDFHRNVRKWENGCGYDFVIGNGSLSGDGEIEVGPRWTRQIQGAHAKTADNRFNERGVGICLVGDFNTGHHRPSKAQMDALVRLVRWLRQRYGIKSSDIHGHRDCCSTECPGKYFPWAALKRRVR